MSLEPIISHLNNLYEKIGYCFFFRLTYMRVPDILHFIISGRVVFPQHLLKSYYKLSQKIQITFKDKAQADEKAQHTWEYVSILRRAATP